MLTRVKSTNALLVPLVILVPWYSLTLANDLSRRSDLIPRLGGELISFDQELSDSKPLAAADRAGWYIDDVYMIGSPLEAQFLTRVGARNLKSGRWLWWVDSKTKLSAPATRVNDHVFLQYADGLVRKVELETGKIVWEYELSQYCDHPAVVANGKVFFWTVSQSLYALSEADGRVQWQVDAGSPSGMILTGRAKPLVHLGNIWVGMTSGSLMLVSVDTGQKVAEIAHDAKRLGRFKDAIAIERLNSGDILMAYATGFVAVHAGSKAGNPLIWDKEYESISSIRVESDVAYLGHLDGKVQKISLEGGKTLWESRSYGTLQSLFSNKKSVFTVSTTGFVAKFDESTGAMLAVDDLHASVIAPVVFHNRKAWVATGQKNLYSFEF